MTLLPPYEYGRAWCPPLHPMKFFAFLVMLKILPPSRNHFRVKGPPPTTPGVTPSPVPCDHKDLFSLPFNTERRSLSLLPFANPRSGLFLQRVYGFCPPELKIETLPPRFLLEDRTRSPLSFFFRWTLPSSDDSIRPPLSELELIHNIARLLDSFLPPHSSVIFSIFAPLRWTSQLTSLNNWNDDGTPHP